MPISEESRHELYIRLEQVLGRTEATALMEHLPRAGWVDVATKSDVEALGAALRLEMRANTADLRTEMVSSGARQLRWVVGSMVAMFSAGFGGIAAVLAVVH